MARLYEFNTKNKNIIIIMIDDDHLDEFNEKYRIKSVRNPNWNYSNKGYYHLTICCWKHDSSLGKINNGKIVLSKIGKYTEDCIQEIPKHFLDVKLIEKVVMPDHIHLLIKIDKNSKSDECGLDVETRFNKVEIRGSSMKTMANSAIRELDSVETSLDSVETSLDSVETCHGASLQISQKNIFFQDLAIKGNQIIPKVINQLKSTVTRYANQNRILFGWQSRYYDEIIKTEEQFWATKKYIENNLINWEKDKDNKNV